MLTIRAERAGDADGVLSVVTAAFAPMPFADGSEPGLTPALRRARGLALSLVAAQRGMICGHLVLSPASHDSGQTGWFALGPLSVVPALQRQGIGTALIRRAQDWMRLRGAAGCIVLGDTAYYPRFGFLAAPRHAPQDMPAAHFMVWSLTGPVPAGRFGFHPAFNSA